MGIATLWPSTTFTAGEAPAEEERGREGVAPEVGGCPRCATATAGAEDINIARKLAADDSLIVGVDTVGVAVVEGGVVVVACCCWGGCGCGCGWGSPSCCEAMSLGSIISRGRGCLLRDLVPMVIAFLFSVTLEDDQRCVRGGLGSPPAEFAPAGSPSLLSSSSPSPTCSSVEALRDPSVLGETGGGRRGSRVGVTGGVDMGVVDGGVVGVVAVVVGSAVSLICVSSEGEGESSGASVVAPARELGAENGPLCLRGERGGGRRGGAAGGAAVDEGATLFASGVVSDGGVTGCSTAAGSPFSRGGEGASD